MHPRLARRTTVDPRAWTGPTGAQLRRLTEQLREACPDAVRGRRRAPGFPDRVLLLVLAHRTNPTRQQPAVLFGPSDSTVHRVVDRPAPHLADLPGPPPTDRREPWVVDGPLIPVHDKHRTAKSKNDRRSVNTRIVCRARDRRIVAAGEARPGNRNDTIVFKETLGGSLPPHARLIGDGGYRGNPRITATGTTNDSTRPEPAPNTPSPASRTTRSSANADAAEGQSTTPSPASPHSTTSNSKPPETHRARARHVRGRLTGYLIVGRSLGHQGALAPVDVERRAGGAGRQRICRGLFAESPLQCSLLP